jgi:DNA polymerase
VIDPLILQVLRLRTIATRITAGKLQNAIDSVEDDGRIRDMHVYHAAGTGRYGGRRVQVQNLPRGAAGVDIPGLVADLTWERVQAEAARLKTGVDDVLSALIRPAFTAAPGHVLAICDYAAIEARGVAWVAGEEKLLEAFRAGDDIYRTLAALLYAVEPKDVTSEQRWVGKQIILGCGYGMSDTKFGLMCASFGVKLEDVGVTAKQCVELYRDTYPRIAGLVAGEYEGRPYRRGGIWHQFGIAAMRVATGESSAEHVGRCRVAMDDRAMTIRLPSGRGINYRNTRVMDLPARVAGVPVGAPKPTIVYDSPRRVEPTVLYGGKLVENVVQGIARDLLCDALVRVRHLNPVLHVHDEIVCEVPAQLSEGMLEELAGVMCDPPEWAEGFPVSVEGYVSPRYTKSKWPGYKGVKR